MKQGERPFAEFSPYPVSDGNGGFVAENQGSSNSRTVRVPGNGNWTVDSGVARPYVGLTDSYNYSPVNALITPNETFQIGALADIKINDSTNAYLEALYTKRTSQQRLAPDASFNVLQIETPNNGLQYNDFVPANNQFNPFGDFAAGPDGIRGTADDLNNNIAGEDGILNTADDLIGLDVRLNRRFEESGGRLFAQDANTFRMVTGLNGEVLDGAVNWDVSYVYAQTQTLDATSNYARFDRWATLVDPVACAADTACTAAGAFNPFSEFGGITSDQLAYLMTGKLKDFYYGQMDVLAANFSGEAFEMAGGMSAWAFGIEQRNEEGYFSPDEFIAGGLTTGGASDPLEGGFSVTEAYGELFLPVTADLNVSTSARYSDYDTSAGESATFKFGADYQVLNDLRVRASYSTGFRAPNVYELNSPAVTDFPIMESICEFGDLRLAAGDITQTMHDNCTALNIDTTADGELAMQWQSTQTLTTPVKPLTPEESTSINVGFVYTPEFIEGLQLNLDIWSVVIDDVIGAENMNNLLSACMNSVGLSDASCAGFTVNTDATSAYFGQPAPYDAEEYWYLPTDNTSALGNLGKLETSGVDFDVVFNGDLNSSFANAYTLYMSGTYLDSYKESYAYTVELAGTADGTQGVFPKLKMNFGVDVHGDNWNAGWNARFIGETTDRYRPAYLTDDNTAEVVVYHDVTADYTLDNVTMLIGINNLTDVTPPNFHTTFNANTDPGTYDVIGRRVFASVTATF